MRGHEVGKFCLLVRPPNEALIDVNIFVCASPESQASFCILLAYFATVINYQNFVAIACPRKPFILAIVSMLTESCGSWVSPEVWMATLT